MGRASILAQVQGALCDLDHRADQPIAQRPVFEAIDILANRSGDRQALVEAAALICKRIEVMDSEAPPASTGPIMPAVSL